MEKPRLIASDVDGTLLTPMEQVAPRTADVVARAVDDGVPVILVTGRPPRWIPPVAEATGLTGYAVCANGAVLYDISEDRVVDVPGRLDPVHLNDLAEALDHALPGCTLAAERIGTKAVDDDLRNFVIEADYHNPWQDGEGVEAHRAEVLGHPAVKLLVSHRKMTSDEMAVAARSVLGDSVHITFSTGGGLIEISSPGITKASGLADVAERLGVSAQETISFGDMPNDLPMLTWTGHGVAVANAHPTVLEAADEVTASNAEHGVAQVLERWF
ncbi:HAD family hydrolase [Saccharomonospora azurea]|uniref:HAD family hydrolase n=1 Tax=Saccharomonospora azurea TaxID=40988 RepID=UPI000255FB41|nr:HAD family hydrolase [Saccharomonospora azurea]